MTLTFQSSSDHAFASDITDDETQSAARSLEQTVELSHQPPAKAGYPIWRIAADSPHLSHLKGVLAPAAFGATGPNADMVELSPTSADEMLFLMTVIDHLERIA